MWDLGSMGSWCLQSTVSSVGPDHPPSITWARTGPGTRGGHSSGASMVLQARSGSGVHPKPQPVSGSEPECLVGSQGKGPGVEAARPGWRDVCKGSGNNGLKGGHLLLGESI